MSGDVKVLVCAYDPACKRLAIGAAYGLYGGGDHYRWLFLCADHFATARAWDPTVWEVRQFASYDISARPTLQPEKVDRDELVTVLEHLLDLVRRDDSMGGFLEYEWSDTPGKYNVHGVWRFGNAEHGQGFVRMIGTPPGLTNEAEAP